MNAREAQMLAMLKLINDALVRCVTGTPLRDFECMEFIDLVHDAEKLINKMNKKYLEDAGIHK